MNRPATTQAPEHSGPHPQPAARSPSPTTTQAWTSPGPGRRESGGPPMPPGGREAPAVAEPARSHRETEKNVRRVTLRATRRTMFSLSENLLRRVVSAVMRRTIFSVGTCPPTRGHRHDGRAQPNRPGRSARPAASAPPRRAAYASSCPTPRRGQRRDPAPPRPHAPRAGAPHSSPPWPPWPSPSASAAATATVTSFDGTQIHVNFFPAAGLKSGHRAPTVLVGPGWGSAGDTESQ